MLPTSGKPVRNLYVHVPFCAHKCEYCAFYSEPSSGDLIDRYVGALLREMDTTADLLRPETIYFGGGTPSLLNVRQWSRILEGMTRLGWIETGAPTSTHPAEPPSPNPVEWTVECNPATVALDKARLWRQHGVNRISLGVQSLDAGLLERLGRVHSRAMVFKTFALLREAGFTNVGLDLMFAIPGQTLAMWRATLDEALALGPEHLSCYEVIYEEDTPLYAQLQANEFSVDEDLACAMYDELLDRAAAHGFAQYEIANFAREQALPGPQTAARCAPAAPAAPAPTPGRRPPPAYACRHNLNYWAGGSFVGLGPSAASFVAGVRTKNWPNTVLYCERLERGERPVESRDELSPLARAGEIAAFGLRRNAGWGFDEFRAATGFDLREQWRCELERLVADGWGIWDAGGIRLTRSGLRFADTVAEWFLRIEE